MKLSALLHSCLIATDIAKIIVSVHMERKMLTLWNPSAMQISQCKWNDRRFPTPWNEICQAWSHSGMWCELMQKKKHLQGHHQPHHSSPAQYIRQLWDLMINQKLLYWIKLILLCHMKNIHYQATDFLCRVYFPAYAWWFACTHIKKVYTLRHTIYISSSNMSYHSMSRGLRKA